MEFPLSIVVDYLNDNGYGISYMPASTHGTFDWVVQGLPDQPQGSEPLPVTHLYVAETLDAVPEGAPALIVHDGMPNFKRNPNLVVLEGQNTSAFDLVNSLQRYLISIYEWINRMHRLLSENAPCEALLQSSEPILKSYIAVSDSLFRHIAHTPGIEPIEPESRYFVTHGRYRSEMVEKALNSTMANEWKKSTKAVVYTQNVINEKPSIEHVFHLNNQYAAHLLMVCEKPITPGQAFLFSLLVRPIGVFLRDQWATQNPFRQRYTEFFSSLIRQDNSRPSTVEKQANLLDIPTTGVFKALAIDNDWRGGSSTFYAARITDAIPGCWVLLEEYASVVIIHVDAEKGHRRLAEVEQQVFDLVESFESRVGVSQKFFSLLGVRAAVAEARIALQYGTLCYRRFLRPGESGMGNPVSYIYRFKRYFPYFVGDPDADLSGFIRRHNIADKIVGAMEREDVEKGTVDAAILTTYLHLSGKVSAVCEWLNLPRNTVLYRLKHIEETYDLDLHDPDERRFISTLLMLPR